MTHVKPKELPGMAAEMEHCAEVLTAMREDPLRVTTAEEQEALDYAVRLCHNSAKFVLSDFIKGVVKR
jgi:hypothetical protein